MIRGKKRDNILWIYDKFTTNACRKMGSCGRLREKRNFGNTEKLLEIALLKSYSNKRKRNKSSGSGASPNRRYSPRPAYRSG